MIDPKWITLIAIANPSIAGAASELAARQSPQSPYFDAAVYPHAWGWAIAGFVLAVLKGAFLVGAFVVWASYEQGFVRRTPRARYINGLDYWTSLVLDFLGSDGTDQCHEQAVCEANAYLKRYSLLKIISYSTSEKLDTGIDCAKMEVKNNCSVTLGELVLRKLGYLRNYANFTNGIT
ncbi:uncharacterized protein LOC129767114 [Toxorhynchites rutilus septentrionalis]|uniref:uncharacterized protein LOC129767114 n=1 Tax=Toxorhynchites rutilus septentrionalis TaxID=329112 RepID=UPI0024794454|nr:uncharacterized protein LOC129767114 [Toxorhynchites rutilus septentrionalis]